MLKRIVIFLTLALIASACGDVNMSGEPAIVREIEILPLPTSTPAPTPEAAAPQAAGEDDPAPVAAAGGGFDLTAADYDAGFNLYLAECAMCHGASDTANGPGLGTMRDNVATRVADLGAAEYVFQSIVEPGAFVVEGYSNAMPSTFATSLSDADIANLVKFVVEFDPASMMGGAQAQDQAQPTPAPAAAALESGETLTVRGRLVMGSADAQPIPPSLPMELYALNGHSELIGVYETESTGNNTFVFENVPRNVGNMYVLQVTYDGVPQGAQILPIDGDEEDLSQDLTVYERTSDTSGIAITWAEMLINYAPIESFGLEVWLRLRLANTGDRIVTTEETAGANNWFVSAAVELPVGAFGIQPMQSDGSQRYDVVVNEDNVPIVKDTWPLRPGQVHTISVAYYLPYENGAALEHAFGYPVVDGAILLPNDTVELRSNQFNLAGAWCCEATNSGTSYTELAPDASIDPERDFSLLKMHELLTPVGADDRLLFELVGRPTRTTSAATARVTSSEPDNNTLLIVLVAAGAAMIGTAGAMWVRQRGKMAAPADQRKAQPVGNWNPPPASAGKKDLLRAIATLDDAYEAGHVDEDVYQERRALLSERLLPLLDDED